MHEVGSDRAGAVRTGEELPIAALAAYLYAELPQLRDEFEGEITIAQFAQGYSNLTYLIGVGERELVLRRPPIGANIATAHDMGREVRVLTGLARVYAHVPHVLLHCDDSQVICAPFYVMERLHGVVLRADDPDRPPIASEVMAQLATNVIDNLSAIHALDYTAAGLATLGKPAGCIQGRNRRDDRRGACDQAAAMLRARYRAGHGAIKGPRVMSNLTWKWRWRGWQSINLTNRALP